MLQRLSRHVLCSITIGISCVYYDIVERFLMNVMLAAGGYPWTVIPEEERNAYMAALEAASVSTNTGPFTDFLATLVRANLEGKPGPNVPVK